MSPRPEPWWLATADVIVLHDSIIEAYGGRAGFPHPSYLESALAAPQQRLHYEPNCDLFDLAATYLFHIAKAHAFTDGNKRTAYGAAAAFLAFNDVWLYSAENELEVARLTLAAAEGEADRDQVAAALRRLRFVPTPWSEWRTVDPDDSGG